MNALANDRAIELANEYAAVQVRRVRTRNGVRLEIVAPQIGRAIRLCPVGARVAHMADTRDILGIPAHAVRP